MEGALALDEAELSAWATAVGAVGTFLAVVVHGWIEGGDAEVVWLRLPVTNTGRRGAEDVRVDRMTIPPGATRLVDIAHAVRWSDDRGRQDAAADIEALNAAEVSPVHQRHR